MANLFWRYLQAASRKTIFYTQLKTKANARDTSRKYINVFKIELHVCCNASFENIFNFIA